METCLCGKRIMLVSDRGFSPVENNTTVLPSVEMYQLLIKTVKEEFENITENKDKELVRRLISKDIGKMATNLCSVSLSDKKTFFFPLPMSSHRRFGMDIMIQPEIKQEDIVLVLTTKEDLVIKQYPEAKIVIGCSKDPNVNELSVSRRGYETKTPILMMTYEYDIIKECPTASCYRIIKKDNNRYEIIPDDYS